jgi:hypothetical protein
MIKRRWTVACLDKPKTKASKAPVAMSPQLAWFLHQWRRMTPYGRDEDWVFPSFKMRGAIPMCAGIFVRVKPLSTCKFVHDTSNADWDYGLVVDPHNRTPKI